jgi:DNA-binding MarR family transcriptional regulator
MGASSVLPAGTRQARGPGFLVRRLQQVSLAIFHDHLKPLDITPLQNTVLLVLQSEDGIDQVTVAARARTDTSTVKDVVTRLEGKGLLRREFGVEDRRTRQIFLTEAGRDVLAQATQETRRASQLLLSPLGAAERALFLDMMDRVVAAHDEKNPTPADGPWKRNRTSTE